MSSTPMPPRFVPTLTEVVHPVLTPDLTQAKTSVANTPHNPEISSHHFEDQLMQRVMQRVDTVLEHRLREAITRIVLSHSQALEPRLREEIALLVKESITQAILQESPPRTARD